MFSETLCLLVALTLTVHCHHPPSLPPTLSPFLFHSPTLTQSISLLPSPPNHPQPVSSSLSRPLSLRSDIERALSQPGPDVVICDEGHRIKNFHSGTSQALKSVRSRRRVVLTGYPLQNSLMEYWCMVDFVRPDILGSRQEFSNMFERPILNGQCMDSTPKDVRLMRYRSHVLHSLLEGFVQR